MLRLGCDIGGTFTDFVLIDDDSGRVWQHKVLTTPADPTAAVMTGLRDLVSSAPGATLVEVIHGTTLIINALIERKGARTALITTAGFRDVLEIAREYRYEQYSASPIAPLPVVARELRLEIDERTLVNGKVLKAVSEDAVKAMAQRLRQNDVESVAIVLLHAYQNRANEDIVAGILQREAPDLHISLSADVLPIAGEYERASATAINAYVKPLSARYLGRLENDLRTIQHTCRLFVMFSEGGLATASTAARFPARMVESGPVAGAIAAANCARDQGIDRLLYFDMGGTTAKGCLIQRGQVVTAREYEVARADRFKEGSGLPLHLPVVDLIEIGAGGGSLARKNTLGLLQVGPQSMGSSPGPACYAKGGTSPTVTDADLVLGYLSAERFLGGEMPLDVAAAQAALTRLGNELGTDCISAAWGVHDLVNEQMATAFDRYAMERGEDPGAYIMLAAGGAGPVHAYSTARKLGISRVLIPPQPSVFSAMGMVNAPFAFELTETRIAQVDERLPHVAKEVLESLKSRVLDQLPKQRTEAADIRCGITVRFVGQKFTIELLGLRNHASEFSCTVIQKKFETQYASIYGRSVPVAPLEIVNWTLRAELVCASRNPPARDRRGDAGDELGRRKAYFGPGQGYQDSRVVSRYALVPGTTIEGPALIEERHSTFVVGPHGGVNVLANGALELHISHPGAR